MGELPIVSMSLIILSIGYLKLADHFNIIDKPNQRSSHTEPTIRGGGILFLFALWLFFFKDFSYPYMILGATIIATVSFVDDIKTLSSNFRLPFQFLAMVLVLVELQFDAYLWVLPLLIAMVAFMNIYNFMDGINGITVSYSLAIVLSVLSINNQEQLIRQDLLYYLLISLIVFGFYNFRKKARFFAGDIGSITIAVVISFFILTYMVGFSTPIFLLWFALYGVDGCLTVFYRKLIGEKITEPHRKHIYQKLVDVYKIPHLTISLIYGVGQLLIGGIVFLVYRESITLQMIVLVGVLLTLVACYVILFKKIESAKKRV